MTLWNKHAVAGTDPEKADCSLLCPAYHLFHGSWLCSPARHNDHWREGMGWGRHTGSVLQSCVCRQADTLGVCYRGVSVGRQTHSYFTHSDGGPALNPFLMEGTGGKPGLCCRP